MNRIDSLDWQRGLLALSIMLYHLASWEISQLDASGFLGRMGIYGVSMFFVLSGLSMAIVYTRYINDFRSSLNFFIRRVFRIWPLLWLAVFAVTAGNLLLNKAVNWKLVALNITTAFGFIAPDAYINTGAWSIGNEMVYYALTPSIIYLYNKNKIYGNMFFALSFAIGMAFSLHLLTPDTPLGNQWNTYVNPFNNLFLYCAGVAIYYNAKEWNIGAASATGLFFLSLAVFILYPVQGNQINIVTGLTRVVFSAASILMVLAFYKNKLALPALIAKPLTQLGVITYGVYLLHPIVHEFLKLLLHRLDFSYTPVTLIILTSAVTIIASLISFQILERPLIRLGKTFTTTNAGALNLTSAR